MTPDKTTRQSFTRQVKNEVANIERNVSASLALLSAFLKINGNVIFKNSSARLVLQSESRKTARLILSLLRDIFHAECRVSIVEKKRFKNVGADSFVRVEVVKDVRNILRSLQLYNEKDRFQALPTYEFLRSYEAKRGYLAGAFLASGSVNSPATSNYHLEISTTDERQASVIVNQLRAFYLDGKTTVRRGKFVVYVKKSEQIADFLKAVGANQSLLEYENIRIQRDQYNSVNRVNNCDLANLDKAVVNGLTQQKKIRLIDAVLGIDNINPLYRDLARLRLEHPEYSLNDLAEELTATKGISISKSGVHYRLRKIEEIADELGGDKSE